MGTRRFDGIGILLLGLTALLVVGSALIWGISPPKPLDDSATQQSMAWAAWAMFVVSTVGLVVGAVSLFLIYETLRETRRASNAAERSAAVAAETAAHTQSAASENLRLTQAQIRCYPIVKSAEMLMQADDAVSITYRFANSGQTPARKISIVVEAWPEIRARGDWEISGQMVAEEKTRSDVPADEDREGRAYFDRVDWSEFRQALETRRRVRATITLFYEDVFGTQLSEVAEYYSELPIGSAFLEKPTLYRMHDE